MTLDKMATNVSNETMRAALRRYDPLVHHIARRLLPTARATRALDMSDLVSEGRIAVWEALQRYDGGMVEGRFFALRIRHRMIDAMRRCSDYTRQEMRTGDSKVQRVFSLKDEDVMSTRPSQEMEVLASQVLRALDRLSARERHIVLMRDVEEWTGSEVGADIGVTEARVCQLRKESIARVRAELAYGEAA
jgi:RNA polymerase sigma factor (sigma-70 family)